MANAQPCSACLHYYALVKYHRRNGNQQETNRGYCLDQSVFANNRAGNPVYPPHAKLETLPHARHKTVIRNKTDVVPHCIAFKPKKG